MDWLEEGQGSCQDVCSPDCEEREERICDSLTGQDHLRKLMVDWGYESTLPHNRPPPFSMSYVVHVVVGVIILGAGVRFEIKISTFTSLWKECQELGLQFLFLGFIRS